MIQEQQKHGEVTRRAHTVLQSHLGLYSVNQEPTGKRGTACCINARAGFESQHCVKHPVGGRYRIPGAHWPPAQLQAQEKTLPQSNKRRMTQSRHPTSLLASEGHTFGYTIHMYIHIKDKFFELSHLRIHTNEVI